MPIIDVYSKQGLFQDSIISELRPFLAEILSVKNRKLKGTDFSFRFHIVSGEMVADIECTVMAHAYEERMKKNTEIVQKTKDHIIKQFPRIGSVKVSLALVVLSCSFK